MPVGYTYVQPIGLYSRKAKSVADLPQGATVGRTIGDLDAAVVNTDWAIKAGIKIPQERIAQEKVPNNPYRNFIAVNRQDANAPWVRDLVESYQQPNVSAAILKVYRGAALPAWDGAPQ